MFNPPFVEDAIIHRRSRKQKPRRVGGAAVLDLAHQYAIAFRQPDRATHPARDPRRGDADAEARPLGALAATQRSDAILE